MNKGMMIGLAAGLGAAAGLLLHTDKGRQLSRQAGDFMQDRYHGMVDRFSSESEVESLVQEALAEPHPDTAMAHAFEQAAG